MASSERSRAKNFRVAAFRRSSTEAADGAGRGAAPGLPGVVAAGATGGLAGLGLTAAVTGLMAAILGAAAGFLAAAVLWAAGAFRAVAFFAGEAFRLGADLLVAAIRLGAAEPAAMAFVPALWPLFPFAGTRTIITNLRGPFPPAIKVEPTTALSKRKAHKGRKGREFAQRNIAKNAEMTLSVPKTFTRSQAEAPDSAS